MDSPGYPHYGKGLWNTPLHSLNNFCSLSLLQHKILEEWSNRSIVVTHGKPRSYKCPHALQDVLVFIRFQNKNCCVSRISLNIPETTLIHAFEELIKIDISVSCLPHCCIPSSKALLFSSPQIWDDYTRQRTKTTVFFPPEYFGSVFLRQTQNLYELHREGRLPRAAEAAHV